MTQMVQDLKKMESDDHNQNVALYYSIIACIHLLTSSRVVSTLYRYM